MIKVFYIEDKNGQYVSADGTKRWTRLTGKALYDFLQTERGRQTYFFVDTNDSGVAIGVEVRDEQEKTAIKFETGHHRYLLKQESETGYITVSFDFLEMRDGISTGEEVVPDEETGVDEMVLHWIDLEELQSALTSLDEDEYALIYALYLQEDPMTERAYGKVMGIPHTTVESRKKRILRKLKSFFD